MVRIHESEPGVIMKDTLYLQSIKIEDPLYGDALQALARLGSLEWIESIKNTDQYDDSVKAREIKNSKELETLLEKFIAD